MTKNFYVYMVTNTYHSVLYVGVTNNLDGRVYDHRTGEGSFFTSKYRTWKLVYYEHFTDPKSAIEREKQIKGYRRDKKVALIKSLNPKWKDLYEEH